MGPNSTRPFLWVAVVFSFLSTTLQGQSDNAVHFTASQLTSDAYILLEWEISAACLNWDNGQPAYLQIVDSLTGKTLYSELLEFPTGASEPANGSFLYFIGPDRQANCRLEVYSYGPGSPLCTPRVSAWGSTLPFQAPRLSASDGDYPDKVVLTLTRDTASPLGSFTHLASYFLIYRGDRLIATLDSLQIQGSDTLTITDAYQFSGVNSLKNGETYTYKVVAQSLVFNALYPTIGQITDQGSTWPIAFAATDATHTHTVGLQWNSLAPVAAQIDLLKIHRDGQLLATLAPDKTAYTDDRPVYGKRHRYELILSKDGTDLVSIPDTGYVDPNGRIAGRVVTKDQGYGVPGVRIRLESTLEGNVFRDSVLTDSTGAYSFERLYYAESGVFTVTATRTGQTFSSNPRRVELRRDQPLAKDVNFTAQKGYTLAKGPLPVMETLTLFADTLNNAVRLSWSYRKPAAGTAYVQVLRDGKLLALWEDNGPKETVDTAFSDASGIPLTSYSYTVGVYGFTGKDSLTASSKKGEILFPGVYPAKSLTVNAVSDTGIVRLAWTYPPTPNVEGFMLYRDGAGIATLPPGTAAYADLEGSPGQKHEYALTSYVVREGETYVSKRAGKTVTYPALPRPNGLMVSPGQDLLEFTWMGTPGTSYNFDGFLLFRKKGTAVERIARVEKEYPTAFRDLTGIPGQTYSYGLVSFAASRLGAEWVSDTLYLENQHFPDLSPPAFLAAQAQPDSRSVRLTWDYSAPHNDGFLLYRDPDTIPIATLKAGKTNFTDYLNQALNAPKTFTYRLCAYVDREGGVWRSAPKTASVTITTPAPTYPPLAQHFQASEGYPGRVLLTWDYVPYILPEFRLFRNNEALGTVDAYQRSFADTTALPGITYVYSLQAVRGDSLSGKVFDEGSLRSMKRLSGRVATREGMTGVEGARITASSQGSPSARYHALTDAAGYYRFEDLAFADSLTYQVQAVALNHHLEDSAQIVQLLSSIDFYEVNFFSTKTPIPAAEDEVALPLGVAAVPDPLRGWVDVRWSASSDNYTGFEVYRSLTLLGTVSKGLPLTKTDSLGAPDIDYSYRVRAYWDRDDGSRLWSAFTSAPVTYPAVPPVEQARALPNRNFDRVELSWSHPTGQISRFRIEREGKPSAVFMVPAKAPMRLWDTLGLPGQIYRYTIYAVLERGGEAQLSLPVVLRNIPYPGVAPVENLTATTVPNGVELQWSRTDGEVEGFYIFRDDKPVDTLSGEQTRFTDYGGIPDTAHTYAVAAWYTAADGETYASNLRKAVHTYPRLIPLTNLILQDSAGGKLLSWTYPYTEGYNGFELFLADGDSLELALISSDVQHYLDLSGVPGIPYSWGIRVYKKVEGGRYYSDMVQSGSDYPALPAPENLSASDGTYENYVLLEWDYNSDLNDGFIVFRDSVAIDTVWEKGVRRYVDIIPVEQTYYVSSYSYHLKAFNDTHEQYFESERSNIDTGRLQITIPSNRYELEFSGKSFTANKVTLSGDYAAVFERFSNTLPNTDALRIHFYNRDVSGNWTYSGQEIEGRKEGFSSPDLLDMKKDFLLVNQGGTAKLYKKSEGNNNTWEPYSESGPFDLSFNSLKGKINSNRNELLLGWSGSFEDQVHIFSIDEHTAPSSGWSAQYFNDRGELRAENLVLERIDPEINFNWGGGSPEPGAVDEGPFSVRWEGYIRPPESGFYTFYTKTDDGVRLWVNNELLIDKWKPQSSTEYKSYILILENGKWYPVKMEYYENGDMASAYLKWEGFNFNKTIIDKTIINKSYVISKRPKCSFHFETLADIAINDKFAVASGVDENKGNKLRFSVLESNQWSTPREIDPLPENHSNFLGASIALDEDYLAVGDPGSGVVFLYQYQALNKKWALLQTIKVPSDQPSETIPFGWKVSFNEGRLVIGAPRLNESASGSVYIFEQKNNKWVETREISPPNFNPYFGIDLELDDNNLIVSAAKDTSLLGDPDYPAFFYDLSSVTASDGEYAGYTRVSWDFPKSPLVESFNIYRSTPGDPESGKEPIATVPSHTKQYSDTEAVPGRRYVYQVTAVDDAGNESPRFSDEGWRKANGTIKGKVVSQRSFSGVPGIMITATAMVEGEKVQRQQLTDPSGAFEFKNLPYGDSATYEVSAFASGHAFDEAVKLAELTAEQSVVQLEYFQDKTANILSGKLHAPKSDCGIPGVTAMLYTYVEGQSPTIDSSITDNQGIFSFIIDPFQADLNSIRLHLSSVSDPGDGSDSLFHQFTLKDTTFSREAILGFSNLEVLDITDTLLYRVPIQVANTCGDTLGKWQFQIEIKSKDGCFRDLVTTDSSGKLVTYLPPKEYLLTVQGVTPVRQANVPIVDYLRYRPKPFDLLSLHRDSFPDWQSLASGKPDVPVQIVYHRAPQIRLASGLNRYLCEDPANPAVLVQNREARLQFEVVESTGTGVCPAQEGFLLIKNPAAREQTGEISLSLDTETGAFPEYVFTVGEPMIIAPYVHQLIVEYHTLSDGFLAEWIQPVLVEGIKALPGSDVIVDAQADEEGVIKYPLIILRDPPGDKSYSYIKSGTTFENKFSIFDETGEFSKGRQNLQMTWFGFGVKEEFETRDGTYDGEKREFKFQTEILEQISTDAESNISQNGEYVIGEKADVIAGVGIANQYGLGQEVRVNEDGCGVSLSTELQLSGMAIKTRWIYSVNHIESILIPELERQKAGLANGAFEITGMDQEEASNYLDALIHNWTSVLEYHRTKTRPEYCLCDPESWPDWEEEFRLEGVDEDVLNWKKLMEELEKNWRTPFCETIGTYQGSIFSLNDQPIVWTPSLIEKYHLLQDRRRRVYLYLDSLKIHPEQFKQDLTVEDEDNNLVFKPVAEIQSQIRDFANTPTPLFGSDIENITFSGNTLFSKEVASQRNQSTDILFRDVYEKDFFAGLYIDRELAFIAGLGAATEEKIFDYKGTVQGGYLYRDETEIVTSTSADTTTTTGYVLGDDEDGDQYSITVIRGVSPSHTPYFQLFGGRSACPPFAGTILREKPLLSFEWPNGIGVNNKQYDIPADGAATFPLALKNENPFNEGRWFYVFLDPASNPYGARVYLDGRLLSEELYLVPANEPLYTTLQVERGAGNFYQFDSLMLIIRSYCSDVRANNAVDRDSIYFSVHFEHPCSEVTIADPGSNWVIRKRNQQDSDTCEHLLMRITDYDLGNDRLDSLRIQYRRIGTAVSDLDFGWRTDAILTRDSLIRYYEKHRLEYPLPQYIYDWDIAKRAEIPDGEYELRIVADCGAGGLIFSNVIRGRVDRSAVELFGIPEPADGFLTPAKTIQVEFNKPLDCGLKDLFVVSLTEQSQGDTVSFTCQCSGAILRLNVDRDTLKPYEGKVLTARIDTVYDLSGNTLQAPIEWSFRVIVNPLYWFPYEREISLYEGEEGAITVNLYNGADNPVTYNLTNKASWLELPTPHNGRLILSSSDAGPTAIPLTLHTGQLPIGTYYDTIYAYPDPPVVWGDGNPYQPYLFLKVNIVGKPPVWAPDPAAYRDAMTVVTNYRFSDEGTLSQDTFDRISAWIGNEIRGVGNIRQVGQYYVAYLTVYGNSSADSLKTVQFRVWCSKEGREYDGHPFQEVYFTAPNWTGRTDDPVVLDIDRNTDRARYIPLNKGWTWFSLNTDHNGNPVNSTLSSLRAREGDFIWNRKQTAAYLEGTGWYPLTGPASLNPSDGLAIRLSKADTLRVTGTAAAVTPLDLQAGWHFLGYPAQESRLLRSDVFTTQPDRATLTSTRSVLDDNLPQSAEFRPSSGWSPPDFTLKPNRAYQLYMNEASTWTFGAGTTPGAGALSLRGGASLLADPNDPATWSVDAAAYPNAMVVMAEIIHAGKLVRDSLPRIAAFYGNSCRGVGQPRYIPALDRYILTLVVYSHANSNEQLTLRYFDPHPSKVYAVKETLSFRPDSLLGSLRMPFVLHVESFFIAMKKRDLFCAADRSASALAEVEGGQEPFTYKWSTGASSPRITGLTPGWYRVTVTDGSGVSAVDSIRIENLNQPIPPPKLTVFPGETVCGGEDVFVLSTTQDGASTQWYDEQNTLIGSGPWLNLLGLTNNRHITAQADRFGCLSDPVDFFLTVKGPDPDFSVTPQQEVAQGGLVQFHPKTKGTGYTYRWDFGDKGWSTLPEPYYFYNLPGVFDVRLEVTDPQGCTLAETKPGYIRVGATQPDAPAGHIQGFTVQPVGDESLKGIAFPNPFREEIILVLKIEAPGWFRFNLTDMYGRRILVEERSLSAGVGQLSLRPPVHQMPDGIYLLECISGDKRIVFKLFKQHGL